MLGGILNGKALNLVKPTYPAAGRASGASGKAEVQIVFDETGKVIWARAIKGHPDLRQAAEDAAWRTTFSPLKLRASQSLLEACWCTTLCFDC